nr:reverse transcriptase domain-containing protein [Tanacetum cinerariifolium]
MAISVISVSSDSSEDSMGTPAGRVILFGTIPTTITDTTPVIAPPTTQIDTTVIPTKTPIIAPTIPPSPDYTLAAILQETRSSMTFVPTLPLVSRALSLVRVDVAPSTLDTSYAVELADGRVSETNIIIRGCTLGLLGHPFNIDLIPIELGTFD